MRKYPKYKEVTKALDELVKIMKLAETMRDLIEIGNKYKLTFEADGELLEKQLEENDLYLDTKASFVDWIRVESYKMLDYVYFRKNGTIIFDVWSDYYDSDFIVDMPIKKLTKDEYKKEIKLFETIVKGFNK